LALEVEPLRSPFACGGDAGGAVKWCRGALIVAGEVWGDSGYDSDDWRGRASASSGVWAGSIETVNWRSEWQIAKLRSRFNCHPKIN